MQKSKSRWNTKTLVTLGMLAAVAILVMLVMRIPIVGAAPYLKFDAKDVIILISGFIFGPLPAAGVSLVVSLIEMITVSESGGIGLVMNVLASCAFACPAAFLYRRKHSVSGAITGLIIGVLLMTGVMLLWNYFLTPLYTGLLRDAVAAMLLPVFLPFNLLKGGINAAVTMLLYKPVITALRKANLAPPTVSTDVLQGSGAHRRQSRLGIIIVSLVVLATCILLVLVLRGDI